MDIENEAPKNTSGEPENEPAIENSPQPPPSDEQEHSEVAESENTQPSPADEQEHEGTTSTALSTQPESASPKKRKRNSRWVQVFAALLIVVVLLSGVLVFALTRQNTPSSRSQSHMPTALQALKITNWCPTSVAPVNPNPKAGPLHIERVAALSANDVWLLGSSGFSGVFQINKQGGDPVQEGFAKTTTDDEQPATVLEHWNGRAWNIVPTADTSVLVNTLKHQANIQGNATTTISLNDLAVLADNNIWLVGGISVTQLFTSRGGPPATFAPPGSASHTLIEHWDGSTWQIVSSPDLPSSKRSNGFLVFRLDETELIGITAVSFDDIWAVGSRPQPSPVVDAHQIDLNSSAPLAEHWNGVQWQVEPLPAALAKGTLNTVRALASGDVWVFGTNISNMIDLPTNIGTGQHTVLQPTITTTPLAAHWNGQQWNSVSLPLVLSKSELAQEAVISDNDIWLVGNTTAQANQMTTVVQHWDGRQWTSVDGALQLNKGGVFTGISAQGPQDVWLLGRAQDNKPLTEHWDGKAWSLLTLQTPALGAVLSMMISGSKAWALVDAYPTSSAQLLPTQTTGTLPIVPFSMETVLETNC